MSKPITRIVFSVLIALVLVVGIYTSVQGAMLNAGTKSAQAYVGADVKLSVSQSQISVSELDSFKAQDKTNDESGHDCHSDSMINPEDY